MPKIIKCYKDSIGLRGYSHLGPVSPKLSPITINRATNDIVGYTVHRTSIASGRSVDFGAPALLSIELKHGRRFVPPSIFLIITLKDAYQYCTLNGSKLLASNPKRKGGWGESVLYGVHGAIITAFNIVDDSAAVILFNNGGELLVKADIEDGTISDALIISSSAEIWTK